MLDLYPLDSANLWWIMGFACELRIVVHRNESFLMSSDIAFDLARSSSSTEPRAERFFFEHHPVLPGDLIKLTASSWLVSAVYSKHLQMKHA